jgi:hypothetical protein
MFNLGSNNKDDLEENMEEIKNLIQNGEDSNQQGSEPDGGLGNMDNDLGDDSQGGGKSFEDRVKESHQREMQQNQNQPESPDIGVPDTSPDQNTQEEQNQPSEDQIMNQDQSAGQEVRGNQLNREKSESGDSTQSQEQRPSSPGDTLFLREEEFRSIRERIEEMNYLAQEMEQSMDKMKKTVRREQETSKNASELVEAFSQRRSEIKSTIESGQK